MAKLIDGKSYSWTQPCCPRCWYEQHPERRPATLNDKTGETCCRCGQPTGAGIWIRIDPETCQFPTPESDDDDGSGS